MSRPPKLANLAKLAKIAKLATLAAFSALPSPGMGCAREVPVSPGGAGGGLPVTMLLSGTDNAGFERATAPRAFSFPDDHGPHPMFRSEWWYFTGILVGRDAAQHARRFGYQLTVFRQALASRPPARSSSWATRDLFMGHLAISDLDGAPRAAPRFHAFQRFARDGLGLAGARSRPFEVWVDTWRIMGANGPATPPGNEIFPIGLRASEPPLPGSGTGGAQAGGFGVDLSVAAGRGPILQGDRGWSVKGAGDGNASFYYSCTRLPTRGRVTLGSETFEVTGTSWLDREWSTSALAPDVAGWDWLGVHLDDGRDLVLYRLRSRGGGGASDGHAAPASLATLIDADGETHRFGADAFSLSPSGSWTSADGAARYPAAFSLKIPASALDVVIRPILSDQELLLAVRYWEGAVSVSGTSRGRNLTGSGYLELTGYSASGG